MELILVHNKKLVKVYQTNTSQEEMDAMFDDHVRLAELEKMLKSSPVLLGDGLKRLIVNSTIQAMDERERRQKIKEKTEQFFKLRAKTISNNIKTFILKIVQKIGKRLRSGRKKE